MSLITLSVSTAAARAEKLCSFVVQRLLEECQVFPFSLITSKIILTVSSLYLPGLHKFVVPSMKLPRKNWLHFQL